MRARWWLAALLLIPLADAALLVVVADALGWVATVALVVLTGLIGTLLVRAEGRHTLREASEALARGEPPTDALLDGALLVAAGAFLLTPGLVTDAVGFCLVLPVTRYPIREVGKRYVVVPYLDRRFDGLVTGGVWTGGFPMGGGADPDGDPTAGGGETDGETVDLDPDEYRVEDEG